MAGETALADADTGEVVERYMYDPYGKATVLRYQHGSNRTRLSAGLTEEMNRANLLSMPRKQKNNSTAEAAPRMGKHNSAAWGLP
jgi:hypothetical protein